MVDQTQGKRIGQRKKKPRLLPKKRRSSTAEEKQRAKDREKRRKARAKEAQKKNSQRQKERNKRTGGNKNRRNVWLLIAATILVIGSVFCSRHRMKRSIRAWTSGRSFRSSFSTEHRWRRRYQGRHGKVSRHHRIARQCLGRI